MTIGQLIAELSNAPDLDAQVVVKVDGYRTFEDFFFSDEANKLVIGPFVPED
jgi:hypothetical protein